MPLPHRRTSASSLTIVGTGVTMAAHITWRRWLHQAG